MYKLLHRGKEIGLVTNESPNGFHMHGDIAFNAAAAHYQPMFTWFASDASDTEEPPFPDEDLYGWAVQDSDGEVETIGIPNIAQEADGLSIWWRNILPEDDGP